MFYKILSKEHIKMFDQAYSKYANPKQTLKKHEKDFNSEVCKYFLRANELMLNPNNKHLNMIKNNYKFKYDLYFSYLEKEDNLLIHYSYSEHKLTHLMFIELDTNHTYTFWPQWFKQTGVPLMVSFDTRFDGSSYYSSGWNWIYSYSQRLTDHESIQILKRMDKFKYIPLEKFEKINYFRLLEASDELLNHWEILLKMGATKVATHLMLTNSKLEKNHYSEFKDDLLRNKSFSFLDNKINPKERKITKDAEFNEFLKHLNNNKKSFWNYKDYIFRIPTDIEDIKDEATTLNHCLYSRRTDYLSRFINGNSIILLMRNKNKVNDPFYTIEIKDKNIAQVRTENNRTDVNITKIANSFFSKYKNEVLELYN